jgi:hypothetical protein
MTDTTSGFNPSAALDSVLGPASAPASGGGDVHQFVADYAPLAERVSKQIGVAPQLLLGQWGLETGWGKSVIPGTNNLGNVKTSAADGVHAVDNQTGSNDRYARYGSVDNFGDQFAGLIGRRYQGAVGAGGNAQQYFGALKQGGYAEDDDYVNKGMAAAGMAADAMGLPADHPAASQGGVPATQPAPTARVIQIGGSTALPPGATALAPERDYYSDPEGQQYLDEKAPPPPSIAQRLAGGFKRGLNQSEGLAAGAGALIKKTVTGDDAPDLLAYSQKKMSEGAGDGLPAAPSFTDVLEGKGSTGDWIADSAGYLGYQMLEGLLTGGVGSLVGKTVAKSAVEAVAKGAVEKQIAEIAASDAGKAMTRDQIASQAASKVASQLGAANAIFANNVRQEAGSIYGDAITNSQKPGGEPVDLTKVWLSSLAAAGVDTAADVSMAKGLLGMREGSAAGNYLKRAATEVPKDVAKQASTEYLQNEIETYGAGGDPFSKDTLYSGLNDAAVGGLGGLAGGAMAAMHQHAHVAPGAEGAAAAVAADPNSTLSKAAVAGSSAAMDAAAAKPPVAPAADPITEKAAAIKQQVQTGGLLDALRNPDAPVDTKTFLNDLAVAQSPSSPAHLREQAMSRLEFAMSWAGHSAPAPVDAPLEAAAAPAAKSAPTTPAMRQAGVDREAQLLEQHKAATTPGARDAIQREIDQNRQMNLGTPLPAAPVAAPAAPVEFTGTDPGTSLGAAPTQAEPTNTVEAPADQFNPSLSTDGLALADTPPAASPTPAPAVHDTGDLSLVPKEPTPQERQAAATESARTSTNDASLTAQERKAQGHQAAAETATQEDAAGAAARAAQRPGADAVIAALKPQPFQRTAEQKATIARAESTYAAHELQLLRAAAQSPFSLTAADKVRLGELRATNPTASAPATLAARAAAAPTGATAALRKARAYIEQVVALGFDTVEREGNAFILRNSKSGEAIKLAGPAEAQLARAAIAAHIDAQAHEAAASPRNDLAEPTSAQAEAGNYKKGHIANLNGVKIAIENPRDSMRRGVSPDGKAWETKLAHHYGDIAGTKGADGDPVDVFIGPRPDSKKIYVVDQKNTDGSFDEHKVMMGFTSEEAARAGYLANYDAGWTGLMAITEMTPEQFKTWVHSDAAKRPAYESSTSAVTIHDGDQNVTLPLVSDEQLAETASPVRGEKSKRTTRAQAAVLRAVAKAFGKRIEFFTDPEGKIRSDGFVREGDSSTIYLNAASTVSPLSVLGHELLHQVRAENAAAYDAIAAVVQSRITDAGAFLRSYGDESLGHDEMVEELVADLNGDLMGDASFWREVFAKIDEENGPDAKGIIAKLADLIDRLISRATDAFKGAKLFGSDRFVSDTGAVRAAIRDGLATYLKDANVPKAAMQAEILRAGQAAKASQSLKRTDIVDPESRTTVSTAQPTAKAKNGYQPNSYTEDRVIDAADITASQKHVDQITNALRQYNTLSGKGNAKALMAELHKTVVDNLSWLFDHVKPEVRERAKLWYDGANRIAKDWTKRFGVNLRQTSGVLAVLSPQMDWFKNVSLGERVLTILHDHGGERWTEGMTRWADSWLASSKTVDEKAARAADVAHMHRIAEEGKTLSEMSPEDAAYFVRAFDEAYYPRSYRLVTPEGGFGDFVQNDDGKLASITWGGFGSIEKAVTLYRDPSFRAVDTQLGGEHKVRNFYNNIVDPTSADGHVTIDTHAVAAALLKPLSGSSKEVLDNLGGLGSTAATGASGSYGLYADAYRDAAAQKGVLAREMQSITWEAIRAMFPGELKKGMSDEVSKVWDRVRAGEIDRDQARQEILAISKKAGAGDQFAWENGGAGSFAADGATSFDNAVAADPAERQVRTLEPRDAKDKMKVSLSAATTKIPGIDALNKAAGKGDTLAHQLLQDVALDNLKHLLADTSARVAADRATGLYAGEAEPSLAMTVTFTDNDRATVLAALAKFADNFNQEQVHVRQATKARMGTKFDDGSYATPVYRWELQSAMSRKEVQKVIDKSGLYGMTFGDDFVEAYYVGDPNDEQAVERFEQGAQRVAQSLGKNGGAVGREVARLWPYGHGEGTIGFDRIRGDVAAGPALRSVTAQRVAAYLNRDGDQPGKVKTFDQAKEVTAEQAAKQRAIADAYESLPDNDLKNPRVKRAYTELGKELIRQYKALPVKVELREGDGEPYKSSADMRADVAGNNHLFIYGTTPETFGPKGVDFTGHPLLADSGLKDANGKPILMNDLLRAVHDYYAHTMAPVAFGPLGEEAAWKNHMAMTQNPWARWALTSETRGQNSWVNFGGHVDPSSAIKDREFARQKAALLPLEHSFTGDAAVDKPMKAFAKELDASKHNGSLKKSAARDYERVESFHGLKLRRPTADIKASADSAFGGDKFSVEPGVREVPMADFDLQGVEAGLFDTPEQKDRISKLAEKISASKSIEPVFIAQRNDGSQYLAEGQHRARALASLGYDSVPARIMVQDAGGTTYARAIKSPERADEPKPVFYSQLQRAVQAVPDRLSTMTAPQWSQWLKANAPKNSVKAEEITWSGIEDYLKMRGRDKLTRDELARWLGGNGVQVQEHVLGAGKSSEDLWIPEDSDEQYNPADEQALTKYEQYTLRGGKNYRELLLTLPEHGANDVGWTADKIRQRRGMLEDGGFSPGAIDRAIEVADERGGAADALRALDRKIASGVYGEHDKPALALLRGLVSGAQKLREAAEAKNYRSSHWDQKNVLAHVRFNERTDADGKRVLFIEELQSDWGQQAKRQGFREPVDPEVRNKLRAAISEADDAHEAAMSLLKKYKGDWDFWSDKINKMVDDPRSTDDEVAEAEAKRQVARKKVAETNAKVKETGAALQEAMNALGAAEHKEKYGLPKAPFVGDTKSWLSLALKRMIRWAVDGNFDRVAFTTGEQNAERYDLSKQIDRVDYNKNDDGTYNLSAIKDGREVFSKEDMSEGDLEETIGKEVAKKIAAGEGRAATEDVDRWEPEDSEPVEMKSLSGLDLKVGGEGMHAFYDQIVPQVAGSLVKKLGGDGMTSTKLTGINDDRGYLAGLRESGLSRAKFDALPRAEREALIDKALLASAPSQPAFDITPKMREEARAGQALFSRSRTDGDDEPTPPAGGPQGGKRRAPTQRDSYRWESKHTDASGPEFYARNFALVHPTELEVNDFAEDDDRALPMGHASFVEDSNKPYHWDIVDRSGARVGELAGQVNPAGDIVAIHDIVSDTKQRGLGRDVVATIAANHDGDVRIIEAIPGAQPFWDKVGAGYYDQHNNTTLDWDSVSGGLAREDRGHQGEDATDAGGAIPAGEVGELSAEEAERLGFKLSRSRDTATPDDQSKDNFYANLRDRMQRAGSADDGAPGRAFTAAELPDALVEGRVRQGAGHVVSERADQEGASVIRWNSGLGTPDGYLTGAAPVLHGSKRGLMFVAALPEVVGDRPSSNDLVRAYIRGEALYMATLEPRDSVPALAIAGPAGGSRTMAIMADHVEPSGQLSAHGDEYMRLKIGTADSRSLLTEAMRRFAMLDGGKTPEFAFHRETGANPRSRITTVGRDDVEAKFSAARVEDSTEDDKATTAWQSPSASKFDDLVYKLQDKQVDTKRVVDAIRETDKALKDDLDVYLHEELYHGRAARRTEEFVHQELDPLIEEMKGYGVSIEELDQYLHARHAREANAVIAQRNPELQDGGSGMLNQDAAAYFAETPADKLKALEAAAAGVDKILRGTNELLVQYQLESAETVHGWTEMFEHYVPLMREDDGRHTGGAGTGQGFSIKGREVKSRTGSTRKVVDILANIAMQRERTIVRGEKNRVAQALVGLAKANPNKDFWHTDSVPTSQVFNKDKGIVEERPDNLFKQRDNVIVAKVAHPGGVHEHAVIFSEKDERAMRMAAALKNLDAANLEGVLGASAKVTRYFAAVNTQYNPVFGVINLMRDVQESMVNLGATELAGQQLKVARNTMSALRGIYGDLRAQRKGSTTGTEWAKLWEEFQEAGGQTGYRQLFATSNDRAQAIKDSLDPYAWMDSKWGKVFTAGGALKVPAKVAQKGAKWFFDWLSDYNEAMENGVRLSAFKAALDHGMSKERAASLAKNLTVNFNRKGQISQQAGALYAFFNASVQGTARVGKTLFTMEPGKPKTIRLSSLGKKVVLGGMLMGTMQAFAMAAAGFRDDDPPQFARNNGLIIPTGGKSYISIPLPMGLRLIPALGRITTEWALGGFKKPTDHLLQLVGLFADSFSPIGSNGLSMQTLSPTVFDPLVALTENKDFAGRPIAKTSSNKAIPGYTLARDTSTTMGTLVAEAINYLSGGTKYTAGVVSPTPDQVQYLLDQITGGVGREISHVEQSASAAITGDTLPTYKMPLIGRLVGDAHSQASEGADFYSNLDHLNEMKTEIEGLKKDGKTDRANRVRAANPESYLITMANHAQLQIEKLNRQKREMIKAGAPKADVQAIVQKVTDRMSALNRAMEAIQARSQ